MSDTPSPADPPEPTPPKQEPPKQEPPPPELLPALAAMDRGDFRAATDLARQLLAGEPSRDVKRAAKQLLRRLGSDPWAVRVTIAATATLVLVALTYLR